MEGLTVERRGGEEDDIGTGVVHACPAQVTPRLRAWYTSFDGHTVSYGNGGEVSFGLRSGSIYAHTDFPLVHAFSDFDNFARRLMS